MANIYSAEPYLLILIVVPASWFAEIDMTYHCIPAISLKVLGLTIHGSHVFPLCDLQWNEDICYVVRTKHGVSF